MEAKKAQAQFPRSVDLPKQSSRYWVKEKDRYIRQLLITDIESITNRELVVCFGRLDQAIDDQDANDLAEVLEGVKTSSIDLLIHTSGGYVDAVEKFITVIRYLKPDYRVIIPSWAKSGGTLIALASKQILLGVNSEMGPVDPQIYLPDFGQVPAEYVAQDANHEGVRASIAKAIVERSTNLARKYLSEGMLKGRADLIENALSKLSSATGYGSHGAVIDFEEASSLNLSVQWMEPASDLWRRVWLLYCLYDADTQRDNLGKITEGSIFSISRRPTSF